MNALLAHFPEKNVTLALTIVLELMLLLANNVHVIKATIQLLMSQSVQVQYYYRISLN